MSEFANHRETRLIQLEKLFDSILSGENLKQMVVDSAKVIETVIPSDVIFLVDRMILKEIPLDDLKKGINKLLNLLHKTISAYKYYPNLKESYLGCLEENNRMLDVYLHEIRPILRQINSSPENTELKALLKSKFTEVKKFINYYIIKENVLFPLIEKYVSEFRCLSVMWSFHDDIKENLKLIVKQLGKQSLDLKTVNRLAGDLFFSMYAIKFREERILYPLVHEMVPEEELNRLFPESMAIGFPYFQPKIDIKKKVEKTLPENLIDLETGILNVEQIKLLFNHLPVDITFVDENNKVVYFSTPKKRIFPRTKSIIGRDVHNCHPPESVHVVEQIVESFRKGEKDVASFWINMKGEKLLIQYFAIRDEKRNYKGVVEVSQEISEIQNLQGEKRLLDWDK